MIHSKIKARQIAHYLGQYLNNEIRTKNENFKTIFITVFNSKVLINCVCMCVCGERKWEREVGNLKIGLIDW